MHNAEDAPEKSASVQGQSFLDCGDEEDLLSMNVTFSDALDEASIKHTFEEFQGNHTNRVASQLKKKVFPLLSQTLESAEMVEAGPGEPAAASP